MTELLATYNAWIARVPVTKLSTFDCPCCAESVQTLRPPKGQTWDSLTICPHCESMCFKVAHDDGRVDAYVPETAS
jgi:hypothetical protein